MSTIYPADKILIRAVNWLGDAVMATPALAAIRQTWPKAELVVLANPLVSQLLAHHPWIDRVLIFDRAGEHAGIKGRLRLAAQLRQERFDLALILPNSFDSALIPWLAGIPVRLGKASDGRSLLLTGCYREKSATIPQHELLYYLDLLGHFGINGTVREPLLFTTPDEDRSAEKLLSQSGIQPGQTILGINAGATFGSAKRWYPERFAQAGAILAERWQAKIVLFGGPDEVGIVAEIEQGLAGNCLNLAGKTTVRELIALLKRCNFMITNDSGPMHIASAFGVPLVAIFGPTDHSGTAPCSNKANIVRTQTPCAPCKLRECPTDHACMNGVTVEHVVQAAVQLESTLLAGKESVR